MIRDEFRPVREILASPGNCWSQGATEAEALENIKQAIEEYLAVVDGELKGATIREVEVAA